MSETAIVPRLQFSLAELGRRIDLNKKSGWGLERGTEAQLNLLALFCQKFRLLPGEEVTLYEGKPWITVDGRVTLMRRHKDEYRGHVMRPLTRDEKDAWGYDAEDIVVETTVRTVTYGEIKAYGRVGKAERLGQRVDGARHNPVAHHNPVEIAMKRSLSRAERFTFGTSAVVDEDELDDVARTVVLERNDPARVAQNAAAYDRIIASNYPDDLAQASHVHHEPPPEPDPEPEVPLEVPASDAKAQLLADNRKLLDEAREAGLKGLGPLTCNDSWPEDKIEDANKRLYAKLAERNGDAEIAKAVEAAL